MKQDSVSKDPVTRFSRSDESDQMEEESKNVDTSRSSKSNSEHSIPQIGSNPLKKLDQGAV